MARQMKKNISPPQYLVSLFSLAIISGCDSTVEPKPTTSNTSAKADHEQAGDPESPCTEVFLTGTGGGPAPQFGNAQSGVFIRTGTIENGCNTSRIHIDAGRGMLINLSRINAPTRPGFVTPQSLDALLITHGHSDHTSSVPDLLETRWISVKNDGQFSSAPPPVGKYKPLPVICFDETCDIVENALVPWSKNEIPGRQIADARLTTPDADIREFQYTDTPKIVWESEGLSVSAVSVQHIEGSVGFKIETAAGNICVSGDTAISQNLINMCNDTIVTIHEVVHPVLKDVVTSLKEKSDPKFIQALTNIYDSHTDAEDFNAFNESNTTLIMTHIVPPIGAGGFQGIPLVPHLNKKYADRKPGPTSANDYCRAIRDGGYTGNAHIGYDLTKISLHPDEPITISPPEEQTNCE